MGFLEQINGPQDLKAIPESDLPALVRELREVILERVSLNGGHLASNLGAVELAVAIHRVFESPRDRIVWDVGHQAYAHKLLTGRRDRFPSLRRPDGLSGFPKRSESKHDAFGVGHSSTSISAALGIQEGLRKVGSEGDVVAVIGDGAMTSGLAFEGLNHAGHLRKKLIVILNDNEMSISPNVGALSAYLGRLMTGSLYTRVKKETKSLLEGIPRVGPSMVKVAQRAEDTVKGFFAPGMLFAELGFEYVGPVDGHNVELLVESLQLARKTDWPVLIHAVTKKGKGYLPAENSPGVFHGVGPFEIDGSSDGRASAARLPSYSKVFGDALVDIAREDDRVVAITAAMTEGTGLDGFARTYPTRFYDVGIAEPHAVTFAGGLAASGLRPVVAIYSTFLQRAYDQVVHDICLQNLPVVFAMDRAGLVGEDGPTHHGVFDISFLRHIPNLTVMAPKDGTELGRMLRTALVLDGPSAIRYPRGCVLHPVGDDSRPVERGLAELVRDGDDGVVLAVGTMVAAAEEAAEKLADEGLRIAVINARFIKPLDRDLITAVAARTKMVVTAEEGALQGGFGSAVLELLADAGMSAIPVRRIGLPDRFAEQGTPAGLRRSYGLDAQGIADAVRSGLRRRIGNNRSSLL